MREVTLAKVKHINGARCPAPYIFYGLNPGEDYHLELDMGSLARTYEKYASRESTLLSMKPRADFISIPIQGGHGIVTLRLEELTQNEKEAFLKVLQENEAFRDRSR